MSEKTELKMNIATIRKFLFRFLLIGILFISGVFIYSDAEIQSKFGENRWLVPAKVYSRTLNLAKGEVVSETLLLQELKRLGYRSSIKVNRPGDYERYNQNFIIYARGFQFSEGFVPARKISLRIKNNRIEDSHQLGDSSNGFTLRLEPLLIERVNPLVLEDRELVTLEQLPSGLVDALLTSEDRDFYQHIGLSFKGILRAFSENLSQGKLAQGGSTLTQQLVKNYFLNNKRSWWRKFREAIMALILEWRYSKDEILQAYINEVYLGQDGAKAIHGFAKASRFYFDRNLSDLNYSQAVTLVALVRGPSYYDPRRHPNRVKERRNLILQQLQENDRITPLQMQRYSSTSLQVVSNRQSFQTNMPAVMDLARRQLRQHYSREQLNHNDLSVFTSIDPHLQAQAESVLLSGLNRLDWQRKGLQGAMIISHRKTGEVLAIVGDKDPNYAGFNRALNAYRQTGSAMKPFVYLTALERAGEYSLVSILDDRSFSLTASDGSHWTPSNYDKKEHGEVTLEAALIHSYNLSTARLAMKVGIDNIVNLLYRSGFDRNLLAYPSLALGAQEMSPWEVSRLYRLLASGGLKVESTLIKEVVNSSGQLLSRYPVTATQAVSPEAVFLVNHMLQKVALEGTAKALASRLPNLVVAGKTGTTDDLKDSWFVGFSEHFVVTVWVGFDDNQSTGLTGATGAMSIWADFIGKEETSPLSLTTTSGIVTAKSGWFQPCVPFIAGFIPEDYSEC